MLTPQEKGILTKALKIAEKRMVYGDAFAHPDDVRTYLRLWAANRTEESFGVVWMTSKHVVICTETLFHGSIESANVYPRVVLRQALAHNAAAAIIFHNHPSGVCDPSAADRTLTQRLKEALELIDVRLLDHMVVGGLIYSFAENGWL